MNKQEMKNKIEELESELSELKEELNKSVNKCWKPKYDDIYYYINSNGTVSECVWKDDDFDKLLWAIGNCFKTIEEAKFAVEKLKVIAELKRFAEEYNEPIDWYSSEEKWTMCYDYSYGKIGITLEYKIKIPSVYFTSKNIAKQAIKEIGEDRIKKYYFGVE